MQDVPSRLTDDEIRDMAVSIARWKFVNKVRNPYRHLLSVEDEEQDWLLFVLTHLHTYDQEKGSLLAWMERVFLSWWTKSAKKRITVQENELKFDSTPGAFSGENDSDFAMTAQKADRMERVDPPTHDLSPRALELVSMLPEHMREIVTTRIAYGVPLNRAGELHGVSGKTVYNYERRALEVWREWAWCNDLLEGVA